MTSGNRKKTPDMSAGSPIDFGELNEIMNNDAGLMRECFDDFLSDYPDLMAVLRTAVDTCDFDAVENTAHKLKGILKYLAAGPAAEAALAVETAGRVQDPENLAEKLTVLESRCGEAIDVINTLSE